jgi:hypothetical protein
LTIQILNLGIQTLNILKKWNKIDEYHYLLSLTLAIQILNLGIQTLNILKKWNKIDEYHYLLKKFLKNLHIHAAATFELKGVCQWGSPAGALGETILAPCLLASLAT